MSPSRTTKLIHEGGYAAEVEVARSTVVRQNSRPPADA